MGHRVLLDGRATYKIRVWGAIGPQWSEYFEGLTISVSGEGDRVVTTLTGEVLDQAALIGIINGLIHAGHALISVDKQPDPI